MASSIAEMNQIILVVRWWVAIFRHIIYGPGPLQNAFPVTASFSSSRASLSPLGTLWFLSYYATTTGRGGCWGCWGWVDCRLRFSHCDQIFRGETLIRHDRRQNPTFRSLSSYHIIFRLLNPKRLPTRKFLVVCMLGEVILLLPRYTDLQFLEYLRTLSLKFQKARAKIEVVLALPCWLSQFTVYLDTLKSKQICHLLLYTRVRNVCPGWPVYGVKHLCSRGREWKMEGSHSH